MATTKSLSSFLMGVAVLGVAMCDQTDQSELSIPQDVGPIEYQETPRQRQLETPEVVLQLKYDKGGLNRIYLAQYHKDKQSWLPSVNARQSLCADLCHAGLGGSACGAPCSALLPVGLQQALAGNESALAVYGAPRVSVCPALCDNHLGYPLCTCEETENLVGPALGAGEESASIHWDAVCSAFCYTDNYVLSGCPPCSEQTHQPSTLSSSSGRALSTAAGWGAWCDVQCRQGHGGAACNCDRAPF